MEANRILDAIKSSSIKRIAFVDDAFDAPRIDEADWGQLFQFLTAPGAEALRAEAGIDEDIWQAGINGLQASLPDPVEELVRQLYKAYLRDFDSKFDPMGLFDTLKGASLVYVRPLLAFIRTASPSVEVQTYSTEIGYVDAQDGPHVVFVDLFLDPEVNPDEPPNPAQAREAVQRSLTRIEPLLILSPSVILMSSHPTAPEKDSYRQSMRGEIRAYASRFKFVSKKDVMAGPASGSFVIAPTASDQLLDVFQTYNFGRGLHETLTNWLKGAHEAVDFLKGELEDLELSDLAYLVRFRLAKEGQSLPDYLEWLLGECLLDQIGRKLDGAHFRGHIDKEAKFIDGAFDGPTRKVADLYHRVRFENKRDIAREQFRLGDLYLRKPEKGAPHLVAVMNPDCDLMRRPGRAKPAAHAMLTLKGDLETFAAPETSVGDFIVIDQAPRNINWNFKAVETLRFEGVLAQPGQSNEEMQYLGALRPMYAQEIQAKLLNQLGRVGVPVAPVLAFASTVTLHYAVKGGKQTVDFSSGEAPCYLVPARQSDQEAILVFTRHFVRALIGELEKIDRLKLAPAAVSQLTKLLEPAGRDALRRLTAEGVELEDDIGYGVLVTRKKPKLGERSPHWACLSVTMAPANVQSEPAAPATEEPEQVAITQTVQPVGAD